MVLQIWKLRFVLMTLLLGACLAIPEVVHASSPTSMTPILTGLVNLYAPETVGSDRLYVGGWRDEGQLEDDIYLSTFDGTSWGAPQTVFEKEGWHVNDPTIVQPPSTGGVDRSGWLYMYYTALDLSCEPIAECMFTNNVVGWATSVDNGVTWWDHGILIPTENGIDSCGAWAPSAVVVGDEIWLYAHGAFGHDGCPLVVYLWEYDANGWELEDQTTISLPRFVDNVDVLATGGSYTLVGNSPDLTEIYRYVSNDGVSFSLPPDNPNDLPLIDGGSLWVNTPHITDVSGGFSVWFGWNAGAEPHWYVPEIHRWTWITTVQDQPKQKRKR